MRVTAVLLFSLNCTDCDWGRCFHLLSSMSSGRLSLLLSRGRTSQLCLVFEGGFISDAHSEAVLEQAAQTFCNALDEVFA